MAGKHRSAPPPRLTARMSKFSPARREGRQMLKVRNTLADADNA
jgi:hypothetical protein